VRLEWEGGGGVVQERVGRLIPASDTGLAGSREVFRRRIWGVASIRGLRSVAVVEGSQA
jgi:hypothetical protein